jgi:hypothetical protein
MLIWSTHDWLGGGHYVCDYSSSFEFMFAPSWWRLAEDSRLNCNWRADGRGLIWGLWSSIQRSQFLTSFTLLSRTRSRFTRFVLPTGSSLSIRPLCPTILSPLSLTMFEHIHSWLSITTSSRLVTRKKNIVCGKLRPLLGSGSTSCCSFRRTHVPDCWTA